MPFSLPAPEAGLNKMPVETGDGRVKDYEEDDICVGWGQMCCISFSAPVD